PSPSTYANWALRTRTSTNSRRRSTAIIKRRGSPCSGSRSGRGAERYWGKPAKARSKSASTWRPPWSRNSSRGTWACRRASGCQTRGDAHAHRVRHRHGLAEPPRAPDLAPHRERPPELDADDEPRLRAPARMQHHAQDAVDAEPGMPEAGVVHFLGPRGGLAIRRLVQARAVWQYVCTMPRGQPDGASALERIPRAPRREQRGASAVRAYAREQPEGFGKRSPRDLEAPSAASSPDGARACEKHLCPAGGSSACGTDATAA